MEDLETKTFRNLKNIAFTGLFTIPLFLGLTPSKSEADAFTQNKTYVNELIVNDSKFFHTYCYANEAKGTKMLVKLSKNHDLEESLVFAPEDNLWIETGRESGLDKNKKYVISDKKLIKNLIEDYDNLIFYHTHPVFEDLPEKIGKRIAITPSLEDLGYFLKRARKFYEENPEGSMGYRICSPYGVTEVKLKEKARNNLDRITPDYEKVALNFAEKSKESEGAVFNFSSENFVFLFYPYDID